MVNETETPQTRQIQITPSDLLRIAETACATLPLAEAVANDFAINDKLTEMLVIKLVDKQAGALNVMMEWLKTVLEQCAKVEPEWTTIVDGHRILISEKKPGSEFVKPYVSIWCPNCEQGGRISVNDLMPPSQVDIAIRYWVENTWLACS